MNKVVTLLTLVSLVSGVASAQVNLKYGFEAGFTASFFDSKNAPHSEPETVEAFERNGRPGLELAFIADLPLSDSWMLSSGLEYVERGGSYQTKNAGVVYVNQVSGEKEDDAYNYLRYRLAYFEVPLRIKYDINKLFNSEAKERLNIFFGPTGMLNVASKRRYNTFEGSPEPKEKWDADKLSGARPFVLGLNAGVEWRAEALILYMKYLSNLTDLYDTSEEGYENFNTNTHSISIGMGFEF